MKKSVQSFFVIAILFIGCTTYASDFDNTYKRANEGDLNAQYEMGLFYLRKSSQELEAILALSDYAEKLNKRQEIRKNVKESIKWLDKAARPVSPIMQLFSSVKGHVGAQYLLGLIYASTLVSNDNIADAYFERAAKQGHINSQYELGVRYCRYPTTSEQTRRGIECLQNASELGHTAAKYELGELFKSTNARVRRLLKQDSVHAMNLYVDAVTTDAQRYGASVPMESIILILKRTEVATGNYQAALDIGWMYYNGDDVVQDYKKAMDWFVIAAKNGSKYAYFQLGLMNERGLGVPRNHTEALKLFRIYSPIAWEVEPKRHIDSRSKLLQQNTSEKAEALFEQGLKYANGIGVTEDARTAIKYLASAAQLGHPDASYNIGIMYLNGYGVPMDSQKADLWFQLAGRQGFNSNEIHYILNRWSIGDQLIKKSRQATEKELNNYISR